MGTAYYETFADWYIYGGERSWSFNPWGDVTGATVTEVRFAFYMNYNGGAAVDLGDVDIWIQSPDGERDRIYYNFDGIGKDTDDGNDSDGANDYDISFWGTDSISKTPFALDGNPVNGTWKLIVDNGTGKTLKNTFIKVWVDYDAPADLRVNDIKILGTQQVDQPVYIQTWIENTGDKYYLSPVTIEYLVEGQVVGSSYLPLGLPAGQVNLESQLHSFDKIGSNSVQVRIVGGSDINTSNNSRTETFTFDHNEPDLVVSDIRVVGTGEAGTLHSITADVQNVGNATYWDDILLEYVVDGAVIGTQTIGITGLVSGMFVGAENSETELYNFPIHGAKEVEVRIVDAGDWDSGNDSRTETFAITPPVEAPDLTVTDIRVRGGWSAGDEVILSAYVENIGDDGWNVLTGGFPNVAYFIKYDGDSAYTALGTDSFTFGLAAGDGDWEHKTFTLAQDGPFTVMARAGGNDTEKDFTNNTLVEEFGHDRSAEPKKTFSNSSDDVELGMMLARTIYGGSEIPEAYRATFTVLDLIDVPTNGLGDDYRGYLKDGLTPAGYVEGTDPVPHGWDVLTDVDFGDHYQAKDGLSMFLSGGLYTGDVDVNAGVAATWQAQGLATKGVGADGKTTLTLTFRGTDSFDALEAVAGQAFTGDGLHDYYESMRPLIDAVLGYANDASNGIEKLVVSGHSLGGATADLFALVDAHRLDTAVDLTVVSFGSPGLDKNVLTDSPLFKGMDGQYKSSYFDGSTITAPPFYIGLSHAIDGVTYSEENPFGLFSGKTYNGALDSNIHLEDGLVAIETPNIDNYDRPGYNFGAGHNGGLYWANISQVAADVLAGSYTDQQLVVGITDYEALPDYTTDPNTVGDPFAVFGDYAYLGDTGYDDDAQLQGGSGRDYILGLTGNDALDGNGGDDLLSGGLGNDTIQGGSGNDLVNGGAGDDEISGGGGNDTLRGGTGDDSIDGGSGIDLAFGDDGNDTIDGSFGDDLGLFGGAGNDSLIGGGGNDALSGDDGDDTLLGDANNDTLSGGEGNDRLFGQLGQDQLNGGEGDDYLSGANANDTLLGGAGNDTLLGQGGADQLDGGGGDDAVFGGASADTLLGDDGADTLDGGAYNDSADGGAGADLIYGSGGNDTLGGGSENDTLDGGANNDVLSGDGGDDVIGGGLGADSASGGAGADTLNGDAGNDTLDGGAGSDLVDGGSGSDWLVVRAGEGGDTLLGGAGADTFAFETGFGLATVADFTSQDSIDLTNLSSALTFADLAITYGADAAVDMGTGDVLVLTGVTGGLSENDFAFV